MLTEAQRTRLAQALSSDTPVAIIPSEEAGRPALTRPGITDASLTWHFTAETVRDFAFAASPDFRTMVMPLEMQITYDDGAIETLRLPAEMWNQGPQFRYRLPGSQSIQSIVVDPRRRMPDTDRTNTIWYR